MLVSVINNSPWPVQPSWMSYSEEELEPSKSEDRARGQYWSYRGAATILGEQRNLSLVVEARNS